MARADSGGFDLVLAISPEYLRDKLDDLLPDRFDPKVSFDWDWDAPGPVNVDAHIGLTAHLTLTIEDVIVQPGPDGPRVQVGTTTGVWFEWDDVTLIEHKVLLGAGRWPKQGALDGSDPDELRLVATLAGNLTSAGHVVQISGLTAHLGFESGSASDIPGVAALLAAVNAPPDWLIPDKLEELVAAIAGWIARLPQAFADRLTDLLPDALPAVGCRSEMCASPAWEPTSSPWHRCREPAATRTRWCAPRSGATRPAYRPDRWAWSSPTP